jgi:hypothetical protein
VGYADAQTQRDYQRRWVAQRRALFFSEKECEWCGERSSLELHHIDVTKKESHNIWSWGEKRRLAEIAKCLVLCQSCHQRAHSEARRVEAELRNPHGTRNRYDLGCKCADCREAKWAYNREHPPVKAAS